VDYGFFEHHGIADGQGFVIHNSKEWGKVVREPEQLFQDGREITPSDIAGADSHRAVENAMKYLGLPYNLFTSNCDHFVRLCHGLEKQSPRLQKYMILTACSVLACKSRNPVIQASSVASLITTLFTSSQKSPIPNASLAFVVAFGIGVILS
jgi:hypothetical protein